MNNQALDKIINRATNLWFILCGLGGATITLGIVCALGKVGANWLLIPSVPLVITAVYEVGLIDATEIIISEETKGEIGK